ncbi:MULTISPECIES: hypothetical protein [unclassified Sphingobacterium]|uniref:hypothetical protein n=1 Tax=unclassified Sphingobacterium TaxID=2609468 RepID=UPI002955411C|nr:hypothetical protein [Sphingobacterium sp. UGAL515B_05]WON92466.1 hypothetical protein OK025_14585 [Sphingobacterium sp. UGAL515B_05]
MKFLKYNILLGTWLLLSCTTLKVADNSGKYQRSEVEDSRIAKDKVGINIQLFDIENGKEVSIDNVKNMPGNVIDSSSNAKLLIFDKNHVPKGIFVIKPTKTPFLLRPGRYKKNLINFKIYLTPDTRGEI